MRLVFLYGPPAVGKLTVAKALARLTGYKVFHNHLTIDLVESIFDWGTGPFWRTGPFWTLVNKYRLELIETAARERVPGLIFTFVYAKPNDDAFVRRVVRRVKKHGGEVDFVQIRCNRAELFRRLKHPSRKRFRKMKQTATLRHLLRRYDLFSSVPYARNLVIDNTRLSPTRVARMIMRHYQLPVTTRRAAR